MRHPRPKAFDLIVTSSRKSVNDTMDFRFVRQPTGGQVGSKCRQAAQIRSTHGKRERATLVRTDGWSTAHDT